MKVTGYAIRGALQRWTTRRDAAVAQFRDALTAYPGESKAHPSALSEAIMAAETAIADLQVWQSRYNLLVEATVGLDTMPLVAAVKRHGGLERAHRRWKSASKLKTDKYTFREEKTRAADAVVAARTISYEQAADYAAEFARRRQQLSEAIAHASSTEVEFKDFPAALLD